MILKNLKRYLITYVSDNQKQEIVLYGHSEKEVIANVITFFVSAGKNIEHDSVSAKEIKDENEDECN